MSDDDGYDWPPAKYPKREAITIAIATLIVIGVIVWIVWSIL